MGYYPHFILPMCSSRGFASTTDHYCAHFRLAFTCPVLLRCQTHSVLLPHTGLSPSMVVLSRTVLLEYFECLCLVLQPHQDESRWFGLIRFRSPLLTESLLLSFPRGNEMFQ